ncbi:unnamed protein product [Effrenium voratum]|nr:unnamed protein product [Effrenium voratum]
MPKRKAAEAADVKKKAADIWQCRLLCLKDLDHSGDTEASSRLWEVVYDADDETLKLFDELKLSEISLPRPWLWQDEDSGDPQHLETALGRWSQQQRKLYRQLAPRCRESGCFPFLRRRRKASSTGRASPWRGWRGRGRWKWRPAR